MCLLRIISSYSIRIASSFSFYRIYWRLAHYECDWKLLLLLFLKWIYLYMFIVSWGYIFYHVVMFHWFLCFFFLYSKTVSVDARWTAPQIQIDSDQILFWADTNLWTKSRTNGGNFKTERANNICANQSNQQRNHWNSLFIGTNRRAIFFWNIRKRHTVDLSICLTNTQPEEEEEKKVT